MADIRAFRAHRYDLGQVGALSDVVCPPYDVIDGPLQQRLYDRSPYNVIRLELNKPLDSDTPTSDRYTRAAGFLRDWLARDVIKQDTARGFYVYHQEFEVEGRRHLRKGFFARVRLEPFGSGKIFPHEQTMSGPKEDRLKLLRATAMNLSPVFSLYPDEAGEVQGMLDATVGRSLPLEATDHNGVISRLWTVTDQQVTSAITGIMGPKPIFIADGHHRYETALNYLQEQRDSNNDSPANFILMNLVGMSDAGLLILPTHRLVSGLPEITAVRLAAILAKHFELERVGTGSDGAREAWDRVQMDGSQNALGFGTVADSVWQIGRLRDPASMEPLAKEHSAEWRDLAVSVLHVLVLNKLLADGLDKKPACGYVHLLKEVQDAGSSRQCDLAVLVPPATMSHVERVAGNLEKMPPKSTYFYPKLLSGLVFNSLKSS